MKIYTNYILNIYYNYIYNYKHNYYIYIIHYIQNMFQFYFMENIIKIKNSHNSINNKIKYVLYGVKKSYQNFMERKGNIRCERSFKVDVLNRTVYLIENDKLLKSF